MVNVFIGPVRFDIELKQLVNTETAQTHPLSNIEFLVMRDLMSSRGQVVSTESLCFNLLPLVVTMQDIALAITHIKAFLGSDTASIIEVVTNQGYLLHTKAKVQMQNSPYEALPIKQFSMLLLLGVMLVVFLATHFETTPCIRFSLPEKLLLDDKKSVLVPIYSSNEALFTFEARFKNIAMKIERCNKVSWHQIYVASSPTGNMLNFVMQDNVDKGEAFRNFKVLNIEGNWDFINDSWLKTAGFCE
ncbi:CadC family transcriptional regulator [Shewanella sp. Choline-02u-19]|nr:CadC family transcriptional regulator [Shewanella sp. GutDb-MelDb]PKG76180.1 CadC family transcriptional regulator [Shewanella sp. GutCb]PKH56292.1 CadC family transcriptional regulator [Shewanella sp. Bg11-22]PKI30086.1 CadC family transcriptional regulator [Shewanella sp. Choline-02u-19]